MPPTTPLILGESHLSSKFQLRADVVMLILYEENNNADAILILILTAILILMLIVTLVAFCYRMLTMTQAHA